MGEKETETELVQKEDGAFELANAPDFDSDMATDAAKIEIQPFETQDMTQVGLSTPFDDVLPKEYEPAAAKNIDSGDKFEDKETSYPKFFRLYIEKRTFYAP